MIVKCSDSDFIRSYWYFIDDKNQIDDHGDEYRDNNDKYQNGDYD